MADESPDLLRDAAPAYADVEAKRARAGVAAALFGGGAPDEQSERIAVGRYEIASRLGAGGMGVVYRAHDPDLDRPVAVKLLHADSSADDKARARMLREARALAKLSHPNVITVYDVGTEDGQVFVAMELVAGRDLRRWLEHRDSTDWREILALFIAAGRGLEAAHQVALVHRDFKPENVLVGDDKRVRVLDFGLARVHASVDSPTDGGTGMPGPDLQRTDGDEHEQTFAHLPTAAFFGGLTETGALVGTPLYMAPEIYAGRPADERSDQFAFCASLYEGVYRELPFGSRNLAAHVEAVSAGQLVEPPADSPVPTSLWRIIARGLDPDPLARHRDMASLLAALEGIAGEPEPTQRATAGVASLRWFVAVLAASLVVVGLLGLELGWFAGAEDPQPPVPGETVVDVPEPAPVSEPASEPGPGPGPEPGPGPGPEPPPTILAGDDVGDQATETGPELGSETGGAPEPKPEPSEAGQATLDLHDVCHLHEDRYTLLARTTKRRSRLIHEGQCYSCRTERRASRTRNFSPRDCAGYSLCGPAPAKDCP